MNRLVIFDLDGTLYESREMHYQTLNEALKHHYLATISRDEHETRFNGLPTSTKLAMLGIKDAELSARIHTEKQKRTLDWVYRNVHHDNALVRLIQDLHIKGWKVAVATNTITETAVRVLQLLGVWHMLDFVATASKLPPKPNPVIYEHCMVACKADADNTWIVEDSPLGREGAIASGAHVVSIAGPEDVVEAVRTIMEIT